MNQQVEVANPKAMLAFLNQSRSAIEMALPKHLNADRMMRLALTSFSTNELLRKCSPRSILASVVVASQLGLEPGIAGQGYLIPYGQTCTFIPGWQGLVGLLNNTGRATAWTGAVFDGDEWAFELGSKPRCSHVPGPNFGDPEKLIWVYACGKVNGSEQPVIEAWPMSRVKKHRDKFNKVGAKHYSYNNFEMYARKVVLLQVLKYMPRSIELNNAIAAADAAEVGKAVIVDNGCIIEVDPEPGDIQQAAPTKPATLAPITSTSAPQPAKDATAAPKPQMAEPATKTPPAPASATAEPQGEASPQEQAPEPSQEAAKPQETASEPPSDPAECVKIIEANCARDGVTANQVLKFLYSVKVADPAKHKELGELSTAKLQRVVVKWADTVEKIKTIAA